MRLRAVPVDEGSHVGGCAAYPLTKTSIAEYSLIVPNTWQLKVRLVAAPATQWSLAAGVAAAAAATQQDHILHWMQLRELQHWVAGENTALPKLTRRSSAAD